MNDALFVVRAVNWPLVGVPEAYCGTGKQFSTLDEAKNYLELNKDRNNPSRGQYVIVEHSNGGRRLVYFDP